MDTLHVFGLICAKHPDLNGARYLSSNACISCAAENVARRRKNMSDLERTVYNAEQRRKRNAKRQASKPMPKTYVDETCPDHAWLRGHRWQKNGFCIGCKAY